MGWHGLAWAGMGLASIGWTGMDWAGMGLATIGWAWGFKNAKILVDLDFDFLFGYPARFLFAPCQSPPSQGWLGGELLFYCLSLRQPTFFARLPNFR